MNYSIVRFAKKFLNTVCVTLLLIPTLVPVLQVAGNSMSPTLYSGDIVALLPKGDIEVGDICCFKTDSKIYVKRVVALENSIVDIDIDGNITVDNRLISGVKAGNYSVELPYTVPEGCVFVLGDNRSNSIDSMINNFGSVNINDVIGIVFPIFRSRFIDNIYSFCYN